MHVPFDRSKLTEKEEKKMESNVALYASHIRHEPPATHGAI
jgi:hypothetical protein